MREISLEELLKRQFWYYVIARTATRRVASHTLAREATTRFLARLNFECDAFHTAIGKQGHERVFARFHRLHVAISFERSFIGTIMDSNNKNDLRIFSAPTADTKPRQFWNTTTAYAENCVAQLHEWRADEFLDLSATNVPADLLSALARELKRDVAPLAYRRNRIPYTGALFHGIKGGKDRGKVIVGFRDDDMILEQLADERFGARVRANRLEQLAVPAPWRRVERTPRRAWLDDT